MDNQARVKKRTRVTRKPKSCPNPLFSSWLQELKDEAARKESRLQYTYAKALKSLQMYPLVLHSGKECKVLKNFGDTLCQMLDKRLEKYLRDGGTIDRESEPSSDECPPPKRHLTHENTTQLTDVQSKDKEYIPARRSGAYGLILALFKEIGAGEYLNKKDLQEAAQPYADCSFTQSSIHERYSAWSAMSGLIKKGLVEKRSNPAKFNLSESGRALAMKLDRAESEMLDIATSHSESTVKTLPLVPRTSYLDGIVQSKSSTEAVPKKAPHFEHLVTPSSKDLRKAVDDIILIDDDEFGDIVPLFNKPSTSIVTGSTGNSQILQCVEDPVIFDQDKDECGDIVPLYGKPSASGGMNSTRKKQIQACENDPIQLDDVALHQDEVSPYETITLLHGQYDVMLCVDTAEVSGTGKSSNQKESASKAFQNCNVPLDFRKLAVGDYLWICKPKIDSGSTKELVLPFVVERKRLDDLVGSIKDGRFKEQKFRLKNSGLNRPMYLVEEHGSRQNLGFPEANLMQAIANTLIIEKFQVHWTRNSAESIAFLVDMTKQITKLYQGKSVTSRSCQDKSELNWDTRLITFKDFSLNSNKQKPLSITNMFAKQLMQLHGLSGEKAEGIVAVYPTPRSLVEALAAAGSAASQLLSKIEYGKNRRMIGPSLSATLAKLYTQNCFDV